MQLPEYDFIRRNKLLYYIHSSQSCIKWKSLLFHLMRFESILQCMKKYTAANQEVKFRKYEISPCSKIH